MVSDGFGKRTVVGLLFGVMWCRVKGGSHGYGECTVVGLFFGVRLCRVSGG